MKRRKGLKEPDEQQYRDDSNYFRSYSNISIHEDMIKDVARTRAYREAILGNRALFEGKVVIDVGAGTGILRCV